MFDESSLARRAAGVRGRGTGEWAILMESAGCLSSRRNRDVKESARSHHSGAGRRGGLGLILLT